MVGPGPDLNVRPRCWWLMGPMEEPRNNSHNSCFLRVYEIADALLRAFISQVRGSERSSPLSKIT